MYRFYISPLIRDMHYNEYIVKKIGFCFVIKYRYLFLLAKPASYLPKSSIEGKKIMNSRGNRLLI